MHAGQISDHAVLRVWVALCGFLRHPGSQSQIKGSRAFTSPVMSPGGMFGDYQDLGLQAKNMRVGVSVLVLAVDSLKSTYMYPR